MNLQIGQGKIALVIFQRDFLANPLCFTPLPLQIANSEKAGGINTLDCAQLSCDNSIILYKAKMQSGIMKTGKVITLNDEK
jgi:hypothetical protein